MKGMSRFGKKPFVFDENRRNTYKLSLQSGSGSEPSVLTTFDGEKKQLMAVSLISRTNNLTIFIYFIILFFLKMVVFII